jgi:glutamine synthetase
MNPVILEYVWLDGHSNLRSKYKTHYVDDININTIHVPKWNYDGSSTYQAETSNSEIILNPVAIYKNPFIRDTLSMIVLCETLKNANNELIPTETNNRYNANKIFKQNKQLEPWFGIEQEYFMMAPNNTHDSDTPLSFISKE